MRKEYRKYFLLNYLFITGLLILVINDHYLKLQFSNWFTGKLSDFVGVLILPMALTFIFPKSLKSNIAFTALFFVFWKSPFSQQFINSYNQFSLLKITRVVDYSDLIALSCLPISYLFLKKIEQFEKLQIKTTKIVPSLLLLPTALIFMATSPPRYYKFTFSDGELKCFKCSTTIKYSKSEILEILKKNNYNVSFDSFPTGHGLRFKDYYKESINDSMSNYPYYKIDTLIIDTDTITDFQFALEKISDDKTKIWINGMNIPEEIPDDKVERKLRRYYRKLIKHHIRQSISENGS